MGSHIGNVVESNSRLCLGSCAHYGCFGGSVYDRHRGHRGKPSGRIDTLIEKRASSAAGHGRGLLDRRAVSLKRVASIWWTEQLLNVSMLPVKHFFSTVSHPDEGPVSVSLHLPPHKSPLVPWLGSRLRQLLKALVSESDGIEQAFLR